MLIAEPRKELADALKQRFAPHFDVATCRSVEGALQGIEHHRPRVLLVSAQQAGTSSGLDLCGRARSVEGLEDCILILYGGPLPAGVRPSDLGESFGVTSYLGRGVTLKGLDELVRSHFVRGGWVAVKDQVDASGDRETGQDSGDWSNPFTVRDVVSARAETDSSRSPLGFLKRWMR